MVFGTEGISKSFGGARALHDVSFTVSAGDIHCLAGENGSGKSTLIKALAGKVCLYMNMGAKL